ncbi:hypothetical protein K4H03_30595, partial [Mycobacterium tuberculosis]|nr:hypothetical protein [Mycobacterium tuberculosis]
DADNVGQLERYVRNENETLQRQVATGIAATVGIATATAAWLHWRRFVVPITVAAGAVAVIGVVIALIMLALPGAKEW